jgi:hypothetical protein
MRYPLYDSQGYFNPLPDVVVLRSAVADHLDNMRPSGLVALVDCALAAINACNSDRWFDDIELPGGWTINGSNTVESGLLVANLHLDAFLDGVS